MDALMRKYALMAFIQRIVSAGSPKKLAGRAALSSGVAVDIGVTDGVEGVTGGLAGKACCRWGLGLLQDVGAVGFQGDTAVTVEVEGHGGGKGDLSSSSLDLSKSPKALELRGDDMLGVSHAPK